MGKNLLVGAFFFMITVICVATIITVGFKPHLLIGAVLGVFIGVSFIRKGRQ